MNPKKILKKINSVSKNLRFEEITHLARAFGFKLDRINGSHHIFVHNHLPEMVNLQNVKGQVKLYQVRQLMKIVEKYNLQIED